jgi:hypothetical protein
VRIPVFPQYTNAISLPRLTRLPYGTSHPGRRIEIEEGIAFAGCRRNKMLFKWWELIVRDAVQCFQRRVHILIWSLSLTV